MVLWDENLADPSKEAIEEKKELVFGETGRVFKSEDL